MNHQAPTTKPRANPSSNTKTDPNARAKDIACVFSQYAEKYTGDIILPRNLINNIQKELKKLKVTAIELENLDQRPYACLPHDLASKSHWFMRRFRNSEGWNAF